MVLRVGDASHAASASFSYVRAPILLLYPPTRMLLACTVLLRACPYPPTVSSYSPFTVSCYSPPTVSSYSPLTVKRYIPPTVSCYSLVIAPSPTLSPYCIALPEAMSGTEIAYAAIV
eukprot:3941958-Rhodomonas_salina.2